MRLNTQSAKSLIYLAIILLLIGGMLGAPVASALVFGLAAVVPCCRRCLPRGAYFVTAVIALLAGYAAVATSLEGDPAYDACCFRARAARLLPALAKQGRRYPRAGNSALRRKVWMTSQQRYACS